MKAMVLSDFSPIESRPLKLKEVKRKISMTQTDLKNREKSIDELKQAKP